MEQPTVQTLSPPLESAVQVLEGHSFQLLSLAFHPTSGLLVSAGEDNIIRIWDWQAGALQRTLLGHTRAVNNVDFNEGGNLLVSCSSDQTISIWDAANGWELTKTFIGHEHTVSSVRFMPGGQHIVSGSRDGTVRFWDVASGDQMRIIRLNGKDDTAKGCGDWVRCIQPSIDGQSILIALNNNAYLNDTHTGDIMVKFAGHSNPVNVVAFAPPAAYPAICVLAAQEPTIVLNQQGRYMASGARDHTIIVWDCTTGEKLKTLIGHENWVRAIAFHPHGQHLLSASDDYTIRVWELKSGTCIRIIQAHNHFVTCMTMASRSGKLSDVIASGSVDATVKIWDASEWVPDVSARM